MLIIYFRTAPVRRVKRKVFGSLSAEGKRKALKDVRILFKSKEDEYKEPVARLAGFVIQQVWHGLVQMTDTLNYDLNTGCNLVYVAIILPAYTRFLWYLHTLVCSLKWVCVRYLFALIWRRLAEVMRKFTINLLIFLLYYHYKRYTRYLAKFVVFHIKREILLKTVNYFILDLTE